MPTTRDVESEVKYPTPTFQNFRLRPFNIKGRKLGCWNRGTQQEVFVSKKVSKEIVSFQQEFPVLECDVKNDPTGHPESESDKKIRLRLQLPVLLGIRLLLHP